MKLILILLFLLILINLAFGEEELDLVLKYAPIIKFDEKEPFFPVRIGYTIFRTSGRSPSFSRDIKLSENEIAIEYAIYWDWDIQHLYELEHVWVYIKDEKITKVEASWHGNYKEMKGVKIIGTHPILYSQPGKHAFAPSPSWFQSLFLKYLMFIVPCKKKAGKGGILIKSMFHGLIEKTPEDDKLVEIYLKRFAFKPTFNFIKEFIPEKELYVPWKDLFEEIPKRIKSWIEKLRKKQI
ncbi:MAG: hypothetical protein NZ841_03460 [Dictyoglomus sp.]|nr:hypothetical protein [Dictyoglomus sp.]MCX7942250.1 hypothetical protein [Dictyoglomaceae bacterium]MDW8188337.1 hypothetical protein [Dictyoglomus sp.]